MPTLARFTSRDPLADTEVPVLGGFSPAVQAAIIQQYAYANNSPPNFMDPWYDMAYETGRDLSHCRPCPAGLDGGVKNSTKEGKREEYPEF